MLFIGAEGSQLQRDPDLHLLAAACPTLRF
jgi:hypothetical protein